MPAHNAQLQECIDAAVAESTRHYPVVDYVFILCHCGIAQTRPTRSASTRIWLSGEQSRLQ